MHRKKYFYQEKVPKNKIKLSQKGNELHNVPNRKTKLVNHINRMTGNLTLILPLRFAMLILYIFLCRPTDIIKYPSVPFVKKIFTVAF